MFSIATAPGEIRWNPSDYAANSTQQQAWARELIARLELRGDERVLDVGSGDGKVTAEVARAVTQGSVEGIDASPAMVAFARETFPPERHSNLRFHVMDARRMRFDHRFDLVFSNAALHWVDDHRAFLHGASACLRPGGRLVVGCGGRGNAQDIFVELRAVMRGPRWREFFRKMGMPYFFYAPEDYAQWLGEHGFEGSRIELAPKIAAHAGREGFAGWLRTTWLPYTQRVPEAVREEFIASVVDRYVDRHPPDADGRIQVRMVRLEIEAIRR